MAAPSPLIWGPLARQRLFDASLPIQAPTYLSARASRAAWPPSAPKGVRPALGAAHRAGPQHYSAWGQRPGG